MKENNKITSLSLEKEISDHQHTKDKLKVSEDKYRNVITKMMNAFILHEMIYDKEGEAVDYRILEVNPAWENIIGIKSKDIVGKTIREFFPKEENIWIDRFARVLKTGIAEEFEEYSDTLQKYFHCYAYTHESGQFTVLFNDTTKEREEKNKLKENERKFKAIFEQAAVGVARVSIDGKLLEVNSKFGDIVGYSIEELSTKTVENITHTKDLEVDLDYVNQLLNTEKETYTVNKRYISKSGDIVWAKLTVSLVRTIDNKPDYFIAIIEDIQELHTSEERLRFSIEGSGDGLWDWNIDANKVFFSKRWKEIIGYEENELSDSADEWVNRIHPEDSKQVHADVTAHIKGKTDNYSNEHRLRCKDGSYKWILSRGLVVSRNEDGTPARIVGSHSDISERKEIENELNIEQERYKTAEMIGKVGGWEYHIQTQNFWASLETRHIFGLHSETNLFSPEMIESCIPDRKRIHQALIDLVEKGTEYNLVYEIHPSDGSALKVISSIAKVKYDENGNLLKVVGFIQDITEQKEAEDALQKAKSSLEKFSNNIPGALYQHILYPDGRMSFSYASIGMEDVYELSVEEVINDGQVVFDLIHPDDVPIAFGAMMESAETMKLLHVVYRVQLPKKGLRWIEGNARPERLEDGSILFHAYVEDITERKNIEIELEAQHKYLQSIIDGIDDPIMVIKEDYTIELMNENLKESLKGIKIEDPKHPKCYEVSHNRSTPCDGFEYPCPLRDVIETKEHTKVIHNHNTADGDNRYIELSASPLFDKDKKCIGIIESSRDITNHITVQDELRKQKSLLDHQAHHDVLTGLPNRVLFNDRLEQAIQTAKRNKTNFALLFIDLDHFKEINDSLGHDVGDEILKTVSKRLREVVRDKDTVARLGGDEFTVILEELYQRQDSSLIANKILDALAKSIDVNDNTLYITCSIGISMYPDDGISSEKLLKLADSAMYKAKAEGKNNYQYYSKL